VVAYELIDFLIPLLPFQLGPSGSDERPDFPQVRPWASQSHKISVEYVKRPESAELGDATRQDLGVLILSHKLQIGLKPPEVRPQSMQGFRTALSCR
jgi:hypothetical protein